MTIMKLMTEGQFKLIKKRKKRRSKVIDKKIFKPFLTIEQLELDFQSKFYKEVDPITGKWKYKRIQEPDSE